MLGEKLVKLRKKCGMSQQDVASVLGVTRQTVSNWECDQAAPALDKASELARLYGVTLDDLVADDVEVVFADPEPSSEDGGAPSLQVLRRLEGKRCLLCYRSVYGGMNFYDRTISPQKVRVLSVSDNWLRVEYETRAGALLTRKETAVRLLDVDAIDSVLAWPDDEQEVSA